MNISTTPRRVAQGLLVLCFTLASMVGAKAQCADFIAFPPGAVNINLALGAGPGATVDLTATVLNANGFTIDPACIYTVSTNGPGGPFNPVPLTFNCADALTNPHILHVRTGGAGGPGATIKQITVNVVDNIAPTVACPANVATTTDPGFCDVWQFGLTSTPSDNCSASVSWSQISGPAINPFTSSISDASGALFSVGTSVVRYTAIDPSGNTATCEFSVGVIDDEPAVIFCPANQSVGTDDPTCGYAYVGANASASDNCTTPTITNDVNGTSSLAGAIFLAGPNGASNTTTVTWTATAPGIPPSVICTQTITVTDDDKPVFLTCPMNITVNASAPVACNYLGTAAQNPTATDNCSSVTFTNSYDGTSTLIGKLFPLAGSPYTITWTATDVQVNSTNNCTFTITVKDANPPVVVGPGPVTTTLNVTAGDCAKVVTFTRPALGAVTDCGPVTMTEAYFSGPDPTVLTGAPAFSPGSSITVQFPAGVTVIRYTWSDNAVPANTTTVDYTFNIIENENPVANCVIGPISVQLDPIFGQAVVAAGLINNGSTDNCGIQSLTVSPSIFDCSQLGTQNVTLTVTDNAGNTNTCATSVFVSDITLPVIGCPSSFVVASNVNCQATVPSLKFVVGTSSPAVLEYFDNALDPCGLTFEYKVNAGMFNNLGLYVSDPVDLSAVVFPVGNNSVTLRATDGSANIAVCNFTVSVQDQTGPVYSSGTAAGATIVANMPNIGSCSAKATWVEPVFVDNCPGAVTIVSQTAFSGVTVFSADNGGITPVTYVFKDVAGNLTSHTFFIHVVDTQFPVAKCKDITVNLTPTIGAGSVVVTPANVDDVSTDNCGYSYVSGNVTYTCANLGANNYTLVITDDAGNTNSKTCIVTVRDITAPTFTCPANIILNASASCQATLTGTATATDNCSISKYEYDLDPPAAVSFALLNNGVTGNLGNIPALPLGVTTVTLRASDSASPANSSTCTFTVTVKDVTPPVFAGVPANVTVACNAIPPVTNPTATDNCGTATVSYSGQTFGPGTCNFTITRTWVASDNAVPANTVSVSQVITVQDIVGPVFSPAFIPTGTVNVNVANALSCSGNYTLNVVNIADIADACNGVSGISYTLLPAGGMLSSGNMTLAAGTFTLPVSSFPIGTNVVTLTAADGCGNPTTKVINIVVSDNQAPVFQNAYAATPAGLCGKLVVLPNTTNNCDQLFNWTRPAISDVFDCGNISITETINNTSVQSFLNLINSYINNPHGQVVAQFPVGETTVTYTATQGLNVSTCSFIIRIEDTQTPVITCPSNTNLSISTACASAATVPVYSPASISDNCINNVTITQSPLAGSLVSNLVPVVPGNTFTVQLSASDVFANHPPSTPCTFIVTLVDGQSPVPDTTVLHDIVSNCTKATVTAPSSKDCNGTNIVTIYGTPSVPVMMILPPLFPGGPPRYVLNPGNYVITWSYSDPQNNTTTQPQNVFITVDVTPPVAIAHPLSVNLDAMGNATVTAVQLDNGSFDQDGCGPVTVSIRIGTGPNYLYVPSVNFDCFNLANMGANTVVFAATDINGNTATFQTTVTVQDVTNPSFVGTWTASQMDTVIQACAGIPLASAYPQTATDQCDLVVNIGLVETSTQTATGCSHYSYVINRAWTATDDSGNTATRTQKIIVADTQSPIYAANTPATVTANTAPNALVCNAAVAFNMAAFVSDCEAAADVTITNTLISAPAGSTFVIPSGANISAPNYPIGTYVVRFTATDKCGNSSTKDVTIQVNDATPPTAVCINGVSASLQPSGTVTVTFNQFNNFSYDNCTSQLDLKIQRLDQLPLVAPTTSLDYSCPDADGVTHHGVKLFVTDAVGNTSVCVTYIVIQDNVSPTITCPPSKTVQCTDNLAPAVLGSATATDNCPVLPNAISFADVVGNGSGNICQVLTRTWSAKDLANNITTCNQLLSIQDTIKPVLSAYPPDETISCSTPLPAPAAITATDNCSANVTVLFQQDTINVAQGPCGKFSYTIVRTRTAIDDCGNKEVHTRQIKVVDVTDPEFAGMPDTLKLNTSQFPPNLTCSVPLVLNVAQFLEDCSPDSSLLVTNDAPFGDNSFNISGNYPIGTYWVHFAAIDVCGNVGIDSIFIVVKDNSVPTLVCNNNVVIALGTNGAATIDPNDIDLGSTDNCAIDTMYLSQTTFDCGDLGTHTISLTAQDIYGNTNSCAVQVQVTLGTNAGFNLTATGTPESYFSASNGTATAVATGGTGVFSYLWSSGQTTAVLNGLAAGTYTVTATDVNSGCISVDTIIVTAGPKITITVGTGNACQGQMISIPIRVDNFINVTGFNFGLALSNGVVGTITGISNVNPVLTGLIPAVNSVFWAQANQIPTNLPNGSVLFNVQVQLSNAAVGTTSAIVASALPALIFLQDGTHQAPMVNFNNGSATISCLAANDLEVAGDVFTWKAPTKPVPGVTLTLGGTVNNTDLTALPNADYGFFVATGSNTLVSGSKVNTAKNQQINVGDMLGIQAHAALQVAFTNGFQWIAADVNGDQKVNLLDYALVQKYVLGNGAHFTDNQGLQVGPDWKFINESHVFMPLPLGNPAAPQLNPLNNPVPASIIQHNNLQINFLNDNFVGVLMGDVNGSVIPSLTNGGGGADFAEALKFRLDERALQAGETVTIPFKSVDFTAAQAYQMTIAFDPEVLQLQDIQSGVLPGISQDNFGTDYLVDGLLSTLWVGGKPTTLNDNETLFSLTFKALESVPTLSSVLHKSSDIAEALAIDEAGNSKPVDFEFVASVATGEQESKAFALYQNEPNPFTSETSISFRLPEAGRATLRVFSAEGRLIKTVIGNFAEGINTVKFQKGDFGSNGVFYYELETPKHSDRKKMILID